MNLMALLIRLRANGIGLRVSGEDLKVSIPTSGLSEDLRLAIREHREALMRLPAPYTTSSGELIVPTDAPPQYHWQDKTKTLRELKVPPKVWRCHTSDPYPDNFPSQGN